MRRTASVLALALGVLAACGRGGPPEESAGPRLTSTTAPAPTTTVAAVTTSTSRPAAAGSGPGASTSTSITASPARRAGPETPAKGSVATLLAAGDIASCASQGDEATAALLEARPNALVATLGDNVYESGTVAEFNSCFEPTWGRHKARTFPALGNHDVATARAAGYFNTFGPVAGEQPLGWYSYDLGDWHVVVLNSNCGAVGCMAGGTQERWLREDLAANPTACTLAYWHHPRFSSGSTHGSDPGLQTIWTTLYDAGVDVVLSGHEHNYERFAPLDPTGAVDAAKGIRQFVVGTGGRSHYPFGPPLPGSEVRHTGTFGVLVLTLRSATYQWQFVPEAGKTFTDSGSGRCH